MGSMGSRKSNARYDQGYRYLPEDFPHLPGNSKKQNMPQSSAVQKEDAFLSLVEMITGMEKKFSNQIAVLQGTISSLALPLPQSQQMLYQNLGQNSLLSQLNQKQCQI